MLPTEVKVGWVFRYAYLWEWQHREGREEGDKDRPCLVLAIVTTMEKGAPVVRVLPITHTPPAHALTPGLFTEVKRRFVAIARGEVTASVPHRSVPRSE